MEFSDKIVSRIVNPSKTIIQTMKLMDESRIKSLLVFNEGKFVGIVTNGDLQRAIIAKVPFDTPISKLLDNETKLYAHVGDDLENIKALMIEMRAEFMPILDNRGELVDVVFWDELFPEICAFLRVVEEEYARRVVGCDGGNHSCEREVETLGDEVNAKNHRRHEAETLESVGPDN